MVKLMSSTQCLQNFSTSFHLQHSHDRQSSSTKLHKSLFGFIGPLLCIISYSLSKQYSLVAWQAPPWFQNIDISWTTWHRFLSPLKTYNWLIRIAWFLSSGCRSASLAQGSSSESLTVGNKSVLVMGVEINQHHRHEHHLLRRYFWALPHIHRWVEVADHNTPCWIKQHHALTED